MAALGTSNIGLDLITTTLGSTSHSLSSLCLNTSINEWSRYKPVNGAWPSDSSGYFGFNLPYWNYTRPTHDFRIGDFRGYNHTKGNTGSSTISAPPVFCKYVSTSQVNSGTFAPTITEITSYQYAATWQYSRNTATNNVQIMPEDLTYNGIDMNNFYWGLKLHNSTQGTYYKTGNAVIKDGSTLGFDLTFTNPGSDTIANFPVGLSNTVGAWDWSLFICSTIASSWTASMPSNIINLPTDTDIASLISSNSFNILPYTEFGYVIISPASYTNVTTLPGQVQEYSVFPATAGSKTSNYDGAYVYTNSGGQFNITKDYSWTHYRVYDSNNTNVVINVDDSTNSSCVNGCFVRIWCDANSGASRSGNIYVNAIGGTSKTISISQTGAPPSFDFNTDAAYGWSIPYYTSGPTVTPTPAYNDPGFYLLFTASSSYPTGTIYITVLENDSEGAQVFSGSWGLVHGGSFNHYIDVHASSGKYLNQPLYQVYISNTTD
jgi:hypothetical protein